MYLKFSKNYFSQNGEDGIIEKIIKQLNLDQKIFVCEFGAGNGIFLSNTFNEHPVSMQSSFKINDLTLFAIFDEILLTWKIQYLNNHSTQLNYHKGGL